MAKRNVQNTKKVVEEPVEELNGVTDTTEQTNESPATPVEGAAAVKEIQEELPIQSEPDNGEQTNDTEGAKLDTESETETNGAERNKADDPVTDEPKEMTEQRNRIADDVFGKNTQCKELHFTSDMVPFFLKSDAVRHGATLGDDTIVTINRV